MSPITFRFNPDKFTDAVDYVLRCVGASTRMRIVKLLYLADRLHVVRHGTPILGDRYYRLPYGPVPSRALDLLEAAAAVVVRDPDVVPDDTTERLLKRLVIDDPASRYAKYRSTGREQVDSLSRSEIEAIDLALKEYGEYSTRELSDLTHGHRAYIDTRASQEIDYRLFFVDEPAANEEALRYLEWSQEDRDLLERS
jgi:uncharacterized phage-associated protein